MADASRLKHLRRPSLLGAPPPLEEARDLGLASPATPIPSGAPSPPEARLAPSAIPQTELPAAGPNPSPPRIDGRTLRRSGRTIQFATRVSPEFDARIRAVAQRDGLLLVEVLERALDSYEKSAS